MAYRCMIDSWKDRNAKANKSFRCSVLHPTVEGGVIQCILRMDVETQLVENPMHSFLYQFTVNK